MNDYQEYMNTLSSVIADRNEEIETAQREYASKLPGIEEAKSIVESATGIPSSIFLEKGISNFLLKKEGRAYLQKTAKNIFDKGRDFYSDNLSKNTAERRATGGTEAEEPSESIMDNPTFDPNQDVSPVEGTPFEEGTPLDLDAPEESGTFLDNMVSLNDVASSPSLYKSYIKQTQPGYEGSDDVIEASRQADKFNIDNGFVDGTRQVFIQPEESQVRDSLAPMRDMMERQPQGQENGGVRQEQTEQSGSGDAEAGGGEAGGGEAGAGGEAGGGLAEGGGGLAEGGGGLAEGGGALAGGGSGLGEGGSALVEGLGAALDFDPFTALIGLFVGIGGLIGGIEGADSIKNPVKPPAPAQELVSVVKGAGGF